MKTKARDRMDRFIWQEGEVTLVDKDGRRLDPETMEPIAAGEDHDDGSLERSAAKSER